MNDEPRNDVKKKVELSDEQMEHISGGKAVVFALFTSYEEGMCHMYTCREESMRAATFMACLDGTQSCPVSPGGCKSCPKYAGGMDVHRSYTNDMADTLIRMGYDVGFKRQP